MRTKIVSLTLGIVCALLALDIALRLVGGLYSQRHAPKTDGSPGRRHTVLCIGDSFTMGYGADPRDSYPRQLQALLDQRFGETVAVVNAGMGYQNSSEALEKFRSQVDEVHPAIVLILTGGANASNYNGYWTFSGRNKTPAGPKRDYVERMPLVRLVRLLRRDIDRKNRGTGISGETPQRERTEGKAVARERKEKGDKDKALPPNSEYADRGWSLFRKSDFSGAIACFEAGIKNNPDDASCISGLGCSYYHLDKYEQALYYLKKCGEVGPKQSGYYFNLGLVYLSMRRFPEAIDTFIQGVRHAPEEEKNMNYDGLGMVIKTCKSDELLAKIKKDVESVPSDDARILLIRDMLEIRDTREFNQKIQQWVAHDLRAMVEICASKNIRVILQNYPHGDKAGDIGREVARERGVDFIDHENIFRELLKGSLREKYFVHDGHCNREGYGVMAAAVFEKIVETGMFERG